jgi:outer membrane protein assembly factor BamB
MRFLCVATALLCVLAPLGAVETKYWEQGEEADFQKGTLSKLSLSSEGRLTTAPVLKEIYDASATFLWAVARDSKGNLYAGGGGVGGSKSKLIAVDPSGKAKLLAELEGIAVQALAIDRQDRLYAATSPDGKVYRVDSSGKAEVFYDPHTKYIWAMAFSSRGDLFVATGDQGEIHRVTPAGAGTVFYRTEETHVRSLAIDAKDNVIVGTDPSGLILRISPAGEGFVLYEAPKREVTALAIAPDGTVYASSVGNKQAVTAPTPTAAPAARTVQTSQGAISAPTPGTPPPTTGGAPGIPGGSEIYRIQPDGYARRVWSHAQDVVYALVFDSQGRVVAGTGNGGNVYRLDSDHSYTRLLNVAPAQVTGFSAGPNGRLYAVTGNIGEIFSIGPEPESSGTYESEVLDAGAFSYWGRLTSLPEHQSGVTFETRSGNVSRAQKDWSPWAKPDAGRIVSPAARFLQYRATVSGSAELYDVSTAYEMKNVAPVIDVIEITPANYKFPAPAAAASTPASLSLPPLGRRPPAPSPLAADGGTTPALTFSKGQIGVRWLATDENRDTLLFKIEIRGENETAWKPLKEDIRERYFSWDSTAFPDGKYRVRVTATDLPSNPPEQALSSSRESDRFLIDNTPPEISGLTGSLSGAKIDVRFHAKDTWNVIEKAEYSVNGGEWKVVEPTTRLTDSEEHDYRFQIDRGQGETTIAVRVTDAYANESVAKTVVK